MLPTLPTFKNNLKQLHTFASTKVVFIITTMAAFWVTLPIDMQIELQLQYPGLKYLMIFFGFVSFAVARAMPPPAEPQNM